MLGDVTVIATIAVSNAQQAKDFYGEKLGLSLLEENPAVLIWESGDGKLFTYIAPTAGSGDASVATWPVSDIAATVADIKAKGIAFEHYELPGATVEADGAILAFGETKAAWFKDPDGNILALVTA